MKKQTWWENEWWNENEIKKTKEWLEKETILKKNKEKEEIIIQAYLTEIKKIKDEINKLEELIKKKEKECSKCLAKIQDGDSGLMAIIVERNGKKLIQIQEKNAQN